ncbi:MAG TPA: SDR family oxidoreductase [Bacteroidota bacterium]|nr:SDR family oxidoreductase [Bacteroidota bacterium]
MQTVLVTGPTGFLGSGLIRELLSRGARVRAFARPSWRDRPLPLGGDFRPADLEVFYGDIRDPNALAPAASGCDLVFHTAAMVSFRGKDRDEQLDVNAGGARAVAEGCLRAGARRLVHTSSIAALGYRTDGGLVDESVAFNWSPSLSYRYSKHLAEREILAAAGRGLDAVIVNPSVIVGPGDRYMHGGQLVRDAVRGRLIAYPAGGMNLVGVADVIAGQIAAAEKGRPGERYILGGTNLTHREAFSYVAGLFGAPGPKFRIPRPAVRGIAVAAEIFAELTRTEPLLTPDLVAGVGKYQWFTSAKAGRELSYNPVSLEISLRDAYIWYRNHDML